MVFFASQGMVESGRLITRKCQPCPCTPVSYVSSLYTAAKKSRQKKAAFEPTVPAWMALRHRFFELSRSGVRTL
ncbi:hypothetical protein ACFQ3P_40530, partial [Paraburkholderia sabiae]